MNALRAMSGDEIVAVTIATKNRPGYLAALLATLSQQTYPNWVLVVNDQSEAPVADNAAVRDLLTLIETQGHAVSVFRTQDPTTRYQQALEAVPAAIEFIHRIDDDVVLAPTYLDKLARPFLFFPERALAAVGGCLAGPAMQPMPLNVALRQPGWFPTIDHPTWRLQGHCYHEREIIEMESLWGCAMCYRRSAALDVGGWTVSGQSQQIFREDSDMSARWLAAGYELMMTTEALGWHLVAPEGGARVVTKTTTGNVFGSHREEYEADERLFRQRLAVLLSAGYRRRKFHRYLISDLEQGRVQPHRLLAPRDRLYHALAQRTPATLRRRLPRLLHH